MGDHPTEPGWYRDPDGVYSHEAYWDGERWTGETRSADPGLEGSREEHRFVDMRALARWLVGALTTGIVTRGTLLGSAWVMAAWFGGQARPIEDSFYLMNGVNLVSWIATIIATIVTAVLWVVWLWYAYSNLPALGRSQDHKRFWVWLGWLVPIWSLFRPKQLHNEVWKSSGQQKIPFWVHLWWGLFLLMLVSSNALTVTEVTWTDVVVTGIGIVASVPAIAVVWVSSVQQVKAYRADEDDAIRSPGLLSKVGPSVVAAASFGLAAFVVLAPHSEDLPEGSRVSTVLEVETGECFTGGGSEEIGLVWIVDCSTPHLGESVGTVRIASDTYPGLNSVLDFGTIGCWSHWYQYGGDLADNFDYELYWYAPLREEWQEGHSTIVCIVSHIDRQDLTATISDPTSRWFSVNSMQIGTCYELHPTNLVAAELACSNGGLKVHDLNQYADDPRLEFPGEPALADSLDCDTESALEPFIPTEESWSYGDRIAVCFAFEDRSA